MAPPGLSNESAMNGPAAKKKKKRKKRGPMSQKQRSTLSKEQRFVQSEARARGDLDQKIIDRARHLLEPSGHEYMAVQFTAGETGMVDVPLWGAHHLRVRIGKEVFDLQAEDGGLRVRSTTGGVMAKGTCHNEVIVYPCDHQHRRTT